MAPAVKALTLHQPYASLVACGVKTIETRSWRTNYRGRIAIHAAAREPAHRMDAGRVAGGRCEVGGWCYWWAGGEDRPRWCMANPDGRVICDPLSLGAVVATAELVDCVPMRGDGRGDDWPGAHVEIIGDSAFLWRNPSSGGCTDVSDQRPFGVFEPGRWAWILDDIAPCDPIPARGRQGLWEWTP